ncbi:orotidine 5'-phosphate decarboxylase, partial [Bacillus sp. S34]|nr:orotidine 5'-phosphate decarboxylase [Bacillus sp. S34]
MTVSPYLGYGSLAGTVAVARENGAGVFVLAATSNPEARVLQTAVLAEGPRAGRSVAAGIVLDVADDNRAGGDQPLGDVGLVL